MKKNQTLKICLLVFVFLFAFSIGTQYVRSQIEYERELENNPLSKYLRENYGVNSIEEYQAKLEQEAWLNYTNSVKQQLSDEEFPINWKQKMPETNQYGTSTQQSSPVQANTYPWLNLVSANPFVELSVFSMSGLSFIALLMIPKFGRKLLQKKWLIAIAIFAFAFYAGFKVGETVAQTSFPPNIYFDSLPSTASYVVQTDGTYVWATRADGKIVYGGSANAGGVSGTDASAVIQAAINALTSGRTWKEKVLVKGNFEITDTILLDSYMIFEVNGKLKLKDNVNKTMVRIDSKTDVDVVGGEYDGNKLNQAGNIFGIQGTKACNRIRIRNVYVHDVHDIGIVFYGTISGVYSTNVLIEGCISNFNGRDGIAVDDYHRQVTIANNICVGNGDLGIGTCRNVQDINIVGNLCSNCEYGIFVGGYDNRRINIVGNMLINNNLKGIVILEDSFECNVVGNYIDGAEIGIFLSHSTGLDTFHSVSQNYVINTTYQGIRITRCRKNLVGYNYILNVGTAANNTYDAIYLEYGATYNLIVGNMIRSTLTNKPRYGINEGTTLEDYNEIVLNSIYDFATGAIRKQGANTRVSKNRGYVTENSGTATFNGDGTTKTFTIAHGLAGTPKSWHVEAGSNDAKGDKYVTADATNLTVTFATAPPVGTNNVVLVWSAEM